MNNMQRAKLDSFYRVGDFNTKNLNQVINIEDYADEKDKFDKAVKAIKDSGVAQMLPTGAAAAAADSAKSSMAKIVEKFCTRAAVKARIAGDINLAKELEISASVIYNATKVESVHLATNLRNALNDNLSVCSNVSVSNISDIDTAIAAYDSIKDVPTEVMHIKKAQGTDPLPGYFTKADDALNNMYDLVVSYLSDTNEELVNAFTLAKQVIHTGIRTTGVIFKGLTTENNQSLATATVTDMSNGKVYAADDKGVVTINKHRAGHFHFTVSAPNRTDVDFTADVKQGMNNEYTVKLSLV